MLSTPQQSCLHRFCFRWTAHGPFRARRCHRSDRGGSHNEPQLDWRMLSPQSRQYGSYGYYSSQSNPRIRQRKLNCMFGYKFALKKKIRLSLLQCYTSTFDLTMPWSNVKTPTSLPWWMWFRLMMGFPWFFTQIPARALFEISLSSYIPYKENTYSIHELSHFQRCCYNAWHWLELMHCHTCAWSVMYKPTFSQSLMLQCLIVGQAPWPLTQTADPTETSRIQ